MDEANPATYEEAWEALWNEKIEHPGRFAMHGVPISFDFPNLDSSNAL